MKLNSVKYRIAGLVVITLATGVLIYAQKEDSFDETPYTSDYKMKSMPITNLNAYTKGRARTIEYVGTSDYMKSEGPLKGPIASSVDEYTAMHENAKINDYAYGPHPQDGYRKKRAPIGTNTEPVPDGGRRRKKSKQTADGDSLNYQTKTVRTNKTSKSTKSSYDGIVASAEGYTKRRAPIGTNPEPVPDGGRRNKLSASTTDDNNKSARTYKNNNAFGVSTVYKGSDKHNVSDAAENVVTIDPVPTKRSKKVDYANVVNNAESNDAGYRKRRAPIGTNPEPVPDGAGSNRKHLASTEKTEPSESYGGYAVKSPRKTVAPKTSSSYDGIVASAEGYRKKRAPIGTNPEPVPDGAGSKRKYVAYGSTPTATTTPAEETLGGYAVKSPRKTVAPKTSSSYDGIVASAEGYRKKRAPIGTNTTPVPDGAGSKRKYVAYGSTPAATTTPAEETLGGYAVRTPKAKKAATKTYGRELAQYNNATQNDNAYRNASASSVDGYRKKRAPIGTNTTPVPDGAGSKRKYVAYGSTPAATTTPAEETLGGYAVRTPKAKKPKQGTLLADNSDGYRKKRAPIGTNTEPVPDGGRSKRKHVAYGEKNYAQYENAAQNDVAYNQNSSTSGETFGGYAVKSAGSKKKSSKSYAQANGSKKNRVAYGSSSSSTKTLASNGRSSGRARKSEGIKVYNDRGLVANYHNTSHMDRTVIVMPRRGRSIQGMVVQDDPGRSIVVQAPEGAKSTFRYGEIDALVNL